METGRHRFEGFIAGVGSTSGIRVVVGHWPTSPFGAFTDAMVERADGHRVLLAPTAQVRDFVAATYTFDDTRIEPVDATITPATWHIQAHSLDLTLAIGHRTSLGQLLHGIPKRVAVSPTWATLVDPIARVTMRGVRTRGIARPGRREWYAATDHAAIVAAAGRFDGTDLGQLAPVDPPCRFGFSSTPRRPSVTTVVTTVVTDGHAPDN